MLIIVNLENSFKPDRLHNHNLILLLRFIFETFKKSNNIEWGKPFHSEDKVQEVHQEKIEANICTEKTNVSPSITVTNSNTVQEIVTNGILANSAIASVIRVINITSIHTEVLIQIASTC